MLSEAKLPKYDEKNKKKSLNTMLKRLFQCNRLSFSDLDLNSMRR